MDEQFQQQIIDKLQSIIDRIESGKIEVRTIGETSEFMYQEYFDEDKLSENINIEINGFVKSDYNA
jgi:ribosomal protein L1